MAMIEVVFFLSFSLDFYSMVLSCTSINKYNSSWSNIKHTLLLCDCVSARVSIRMKNSYIDSHLHKKLRLIQMNVCVCVQMFSFLFKQITEKIAVLSLSLTMSAEYPFRTLFLIGSWWCKVCTLFEMNILNVTKDVNETLSTAHVIRYTVNCFRLNVCNCLLFVYLEIYHYFDF